MAGGWLGLLVGKRGLVFVQFEDGVVVGFDHAFEDG